MDIQIVHNGVQMGPFTEETAHAMLKSGSVLVNDLAWRPGLPDWVPLMNLLYPAAVTPAPPVSAAKTETPAPEPREPATAKQKTFLTYMHIGFAPEITREDASRLVNDTMENPKDAARLARWNEERLQLHPELFAAELQTKKENRPQRFLEICHAEGAPFFEKVTKAHCQVLVSHLDVRSPNWDTHEPDAIWKYFFPAMAEKFPPLVTPEGAAKFKRTDHAAPAPKQVKSTPVAVRTRPSSTPGVGRIIYAVARGVFVGLLVLGLLWVGRGAFAKKAPRVKKPVATDTTTVEPAANESAAPATAKTDSTAKETAPAEIPNPVATVPAAEVAPTPAPTTPEPAMAEAKAPPAAPEPPAKPEMAGLFTPPDAPPSAAARTTVVLTKPIPITLPFGKVTVPAGTTVKIVSQNGATLTVQYLEHVVTIPASSTNLATDPAPASAPEPGPVTAKAAPAP